MMRKKDQSLFSLVCERRGVQIDDLSKLFVSAPSEVDHTEDFADFLYEHPDLVYTILSDFDSDGDNSGILAFAGLSELGFRVHLYTPSAKHGYGFNSPEVLAELLRLFPDTRVLITCDNGVDCKQGISLAHASGITVLVTDHHIQKEEIGADLVVDPCSLGSQCAFTGICGAYVIWKCLYRYAEKYCSAFLQEQIYRLRVFAGIATVTDQMPMLYENRLLVREAVLFCELCLKGWVPEIFGCEVYRRAFAGLRVFLSELFAGRPYLNLDEDLFGFYVGPVFNAASKRIGGSAFPVYYLFFGCETDEERADAARQLFRYNEQRKALVLKHMDLIDESAQPFAPYIYQTEAPSGILGLLATELMKRSGRPTLVFGPEQDGVVSCSGRAPEWFPFYRDVQEKLTGVSSLVIGGHASAFGCSVAASELEQLYQYFCNREKDLCGDYDIALDQSLPDIVLGEDGDCGLDALDLWNFYWDIERYRPYGQGFPQPDVELRFLNRGVRWYFMGKYIDDAGMERHRHQKALLPNGFAVLFWNQEFIPGEVVSCRGKLMLSEYDGRVSLQFAGIYHKEECDCA